MNKKQVPVEELRVGMFVAELDRPWLTTPFLFQGFPITSPHQIDELKQHCKTVFIDLERGASDDAQGRSELTEASLLGPVKYERVTPVEKELATARQAHSALEAVIQQSFDKLRRDGTLDLESVREPVRSTTRSIERNPDAMLLLAKIRETGDQDFNRAVDTMVHMTAFGRFLQFPGERLVLLGLAGLLLNIGKTRLPQSILQKKGALTAEEFDLVKTHVMHSVEMIRATPKFPHEVEEIVIQHHERFDGSGYPQGLRGNQITADGAVAGLIDTYSALTSVRSYARQMSPATALGLLHDTRGTLYNRLLVEKFIQCVGIYPVGSKVELNTGEVGIVISQNLTQRLRPRVMLCLDPARKPIQPQVLLNLATEPTAATGEPYRIVRSLAQDSFPIDFEQFHL